MKSCALITGASSGIGKALAHEHAKRGGSMVVVARRRDRLESLKKTLESLQSGVTVHVLEADLAEVGSAQRVFDSVQNLGLDVDILINNAGLGLHGAFDRKPWERVESMLRVNIEALTQLTHLFLPKMIQAENGKILNVSSVAGFVSGPYQAVYYATKAYVLSFSEALAHELKKSGITVTALCPGFTKSEFSEVADLKGVNAENLPYMSSEEVAEYGYQSMEQGKTVAVPGFMNKVLAHGLIRFTPRKINTAISAKLMEK